jgi:hypothetical protein
MKEQQAPPTAEDILGRYERPLTFEKVWAMFQETDKKFQDTDKKFQDTDKKFQDTERVILKTSKSIQELKSSFESSKRESDKNHKRLEDLFTSQWGRLIESLVEGDLVGLLNRYGIPVNTVSERTKGSYQGKNFEFDLVARNGEEVVIVEVKTTLRPADVKHFTNKLAQAKTWMPGIRHNTLYGAMAYLKQDANAADMAMNKGLLVIRATGDSASIINEPGFVAKTY